MISLSTFDANSSISFLGSGWTRPSFSVEAPGLASLTYRYGMPLVRKPIFVSRISMRFSFSMEHASSASFSI